MHNVILVTEEKVYKLFCTVLWLYLKKLDDQSHHGQQQEQAVADHIHNIVDPA